MSAPDRFEFDVEAIAADFFARCAFAKKVGIPLREVVGGEKSIPHGWVLDDDTLYFMPPAIGTA